MTADEKRQALEQMPADYMPAEMPDFIALHFDNERSFNWLSDEQAGKVVKRLFEYGRDYAASYDHGLEPRFDDLETSAAMLLDILAGSIRRIYDGRRETSYLRSAANKGGRPSKT